MLFDSRPICSSAWKWPEGYQFQSTLDADPTTPLVLLWSHSSLYIGYPLPTGLHPGKDILPAKESKLCWAQRAQPMGSLLFAFGKQPQPQPQLTGWQELQEHPSQDPLPKASKTLSSLRRGVVILQTPTFGFLCCGAPDRNTSTAPSATVSCFCMILVIPRFWSMQIQSF